METAFAAERNLSPHSNSSPGLSPFDFRRWMPLQPLPLLPLRMAAVGSTESDRAAGRQTEKDRDPSPSWPDFEWACLVESSSDYA